MAASVLLVKDIIAPQILAVEKDFLLVYKPPRMHSAPEAHPAGETAGKTLVDWCFARFPETACLPGRKPGEGGLLHRLDYQTQGLLLVARTRQGMERLLEQQMKGDILKEYSALTAESKTGLPGFPSEKPKLPRPVLDAKAGGNDPYSSKAEAPPSAITSGFRPFGSGRKAVRPVMIGPETNTGETRRAPCVTEIIETRPVFDAGFPCAAFRIRIRKGFRHQIRSHLSWLGWPILNDSLYGGLAAGKGVLGLRAASLFFTDPSSGEERAYSIPPLDPAAL